MRFFDVLRPRPGGVKATAAPAGSRDAQAAGSQPVDPGQAEPMADAPPPAFDAPRARLAAPEFDEFGAPEGAFGRFPGAAGVGRGSDDEHTRFAC